MPPLTTSSISSTEVHTHGRGVTYGVLAYVLWGLFPAYWPLLVPAQPIEVLAHRIVWSFVTLAIAVAFLRRWRPFLELSGKGWLIVTAAAVLITVNWGTYIYAVNSQHVVESALGYFITPLVSVGLGMIFLKERLRLAQAVAIGVVVIAVIVLTVDYGRLPWIALILAGSFGTYGLLKKQAAAGAFESLALETAVMTPLALAYVVGLAFAGRSHFTTEGSGHTALFVSAGVVTAVPLILFGAAATRVPLVTIGLLQYLAPILQFGLGVLHFHEQMSTGRWLGFDASGSPLYGSLRARVGGGSVEVEGIDGVVRVYGFSPLGEDPADPAGWASVGLSKAEVLSDEGRVLARSMAWLGGVTALVLALAWVGSGALLMGSFRALQRLADVDGRRVPPAGPARVHLVRRGDRDDSRRGGRVRARAAPGRRAPERLDRDAVGPTPSLPAPRRAADDDRGEHDDHHVGAQGPAVQGRADHAAHRIQGRDDALVDILGSVARHPRAAAKRSAHPVGQADTCERRHAEQQCRGRPVPEAESDGDRNAGDRRRGRRDGAVQE